MTSFRLLSASLAALLSSLWLSAQTTTPDLATAEAQLRAALEKTRGVSSIAFKSVESRDDAFMRQLPIPGGEDTQVSGTSGRGTLHASIGFDDDEVLFANGRMLARQQNGAWKLRRGCLVGGQPLPFVADPLVMISVLADLPAGALLVTNVASVTTKDPKDAQRERELVTFSVHFKGQAADELAMCGLTPRASGNPMMSMLGGPGGEAAKPELTTDLAITVERDSGLVVRIVSKAYSKSEQSGNFQIRVGGADGAEIDDAEEEDDETAVAEASLRFSKGLPERKLDKKTSLITFDISLSQHGTAKTPTINDAAKALLGGN